MAVHAGCAMLRFVSFGMLMTTVSMGAGLSYSETAGCSSLYDDPMTYIFTHRMNDDNCKPIID